MPRRAALLLLLPLALLAAPALAQPLPSAPSAGRLFGTDDAPPPGVQPSRPRVVMRLAYAPVAGCPDDQVLRATIGAQVRRWDPFAPNAPWRLEVILTRRGAAYEGSAELRDVTGALEWSQALAPRTRCFDLVEDLALMVALQINPPVPAPRTAAVTSSPPPMEPGLPDRPAPPAPVKPSAGVAARLGFGTWMDLATAPRPAFGLTVDAGFRVAWFSLAVELHWTPPAGATVMEGATVSTRLVMGALVPCGHYGWFVGCLVGELGQFRSSIVATATGASPDYRETLYGLAGGRFGVEIPVVGERLFVRLAVNLLGALGRPRTRLGPTAMTPQVLWESGGFTGGLGAGLVASF